MRANRWTKPVIAALLLGPLVLAVAPSGAAPTPNNGAGTDALPVPPILQAYPGGNAAGGVALCEIQGPHDWGQGVTTTSWGYTPANANGSCPATGNTLLGPTVEAKSGVPVALRVTNDLPVGVETNPLDDVLDDTIEGATESSGGPDIDAPSTAVHLHGGHMPVADDGSPDQGFGPGQTITNHYPNDQEATNLWFHDHALGITRLNVMNGLAAFYLLRDANDTGRADNPVGLPAPYGVYEVPLALQDRSFNNGSVDYGFGFWADKPEAGKICGSDTPPAGCTVRYPKTWQPEYFGNVATVNGKIQPHLDVQRGVYRFRVLNGSNARFYVLSLSDPSVPMFQVGAEGGLLDVPVRLDKLVIAPGERADLLVDFTRAAPGSHIVLRNNGAAPYPGGGGGPDLPNIMRFDVGSAKGAFTKIPIRLRVTGGAKAQLVATPALLARNPNIRTRDVYLNELLDPLTGEPVGARLNNLPFHDGASVEHPKAGTAEVWNIVNTTGDTHPIHVHLGMIRVIGRQSFLHGDAQPYVDALNATLGGPKLPDPVAGDKGPWPNATKPPTPNLASFHLTDAKPPARTEAGWKDTVQVPPGGVTRILIVWGDEVAGSPFTGPTYTVTPGHEYVWHCHILEHEENDMMQWYGPTASGN